MSTTTQTKHEVKSELYVFRYDANRGRKLPEQLTHKPELSDGLDMFIQKCGYRLLPGLSPALETFESSGEAADRFLIVAHYGQTVLAIFASSLKDYTRFMEQHLACFSVWPHVFMPEPAPSVDNRIVYPSPFARQMRG